MDHYWVKWTERQWKHVLWQEEFQLVVWKKWVLGFLCQPKKYHPHCYQAKGAKASKLYVMLLYQKTGGYWTFCGASHLILFQHHEQGVRQWWPQTVEAHLNVYRGNLGELTLAITSFHLSNVSLPCILCSPVSFSPHHLFHHNLSCPRAFPHWLVLRHQLTLPWAWSCNQCESLINISKHWVTFPIWF